MNKQVATTPVANHKPDEREIAAVAEAEERDEQRRRPVQIDATLKGSALTVKITSDARLQDAFGTASKAFVHAQLEALERVTRRRGAPAFESSDCLNAALASVEALRPANEIEASLGVQMAGTHALALDCLSRAKHADLFDHVEMFGGLAVKLLRTYTAQVEALAKIKGGGKQQVEVRHVHINGNAVIGDVHGGGGGETANERRPHAPALVHAPGEPVRSSLAAERQAVPSACSERTGAL